MKASSPTWSTVSLGEVADIKTGPFGSALHQSDYQRSGTPIVTVEHLGERGLTRRNLPLVGESDARRLSAYRCQSGDILFSRVGSIDRNSLVGVQEEGWLFSGRLLRVRVDRRYVYPAFLSYQFATAWFKDTVRAAAVGQTMPSLNTAILSHLDVRLPTLAVQKRIAEQLVSADNQIAALERLIFKKQAIKQGMMQELLTGKTRLPGFAGAWNNAMLGDHVTYVRTVSLSRAQLDSDSATRYLHYGDIHKQRSNILDATKESMPRASADLLGTAGHLQPGDLVFADASEDPDGVGKSVEIAAVPGQGVVPGLHTIAARFDKRVLADGFKAYLQFIPAFRQALLRLAAGTKVLATTRAYISSVTLSLPSPSEQRAIAEILTDAEAEICTLRLRLKKARDMKQGMMQELLTGRTRLPIEEVST